MGFVKTNQAARATRPRELRPVHFQPVRPPDAADEALITSRSRAMATKTLLNVIALQLMLACPYCHATASKPAAGSRVIVVFDDARLQQFAAEAVAQAAAADAVPSYDTSGRTHNAALKEAVVQANSVWLPAAAAMAADLLATARASGITATSSICYGLLLNGCSYAADTLSDAAALERLLSADARVAAVYPAVSAGSTALLAAGKQSLCSSSSVASCAD